MSKVHLVAIENGCRRDLTLRANRHSLCAPPQAAHPVTLCGRCLRVPRLDPLHITCSLDQATCGSCRRAALMRDFRGSITVGAPSRLTCAQPDRHVPKLVCGYPLPCPHHTLTLGLPR